MCGLLCLFDFFFFKQKTAYEMRISDWSSDVCSSDLYSGSAFGKYRRRRTVPYCFCWRFGKAERGSHAERTAGSTYPHCNRRPSWPSAGYRAFYFERWARALPSRGNFGCAQQSQYQYKAAQHRKRGVQGTGVQVEVDEGG